MHSTLQIHISNPQFLSICVVHVLNMHSHYVYICYIRLPTGWHRILRLLVNKINEPEFCLCDLRLVPPNSMVRMIHPMRILVRLVLNWKFLGIISRFCNTLSAIGCMCNTPHRKKVNTYGLLKNKKNRLLGLLKIVNIPLWSYTWIDHVTRKDESRAWTWFWFNL